MYSVDEEVGVINYNHGNGGFQGIYRVTKSNKVRIHLKRVTDGYERIFSAKTGAEQGSVSRYRSAAIVTLAKYKELERAKIQRGHLDLAWKHVQHAASNRNLTNLKEAISKIEELIDQ